MIVDFPRDFEQAVLENFPFKPEAVQALENGDKNVVHHHLAGGVAKTSKNLTTIVGLEEVEAQIAAINPRLARALKAVREKANPQDLEVHTEALHDQMLTLARFDRIVAEQRDLSL